MGTRCNTGGAKWPNGLPPGWCMQDPIYDVSLWYDKRNFILRNESDSVMRATVKRTLTNGTELTVEIDVNDYHQTDQIVWLAGTDTGALELLAVAKTPQDDSTSALNHVSVEQEHSGDTLTFVRNHWPVPIYISLDIFRDNLPRADSIVRHVLNPRARLPVYSDRSAPSLKWRAGVLERADLYQQWPPQPALTIRTAIP